MSGHNVNYGAGNVDLGSGARMNDGYVVRGPKLQTATPIDSADSIAVTNFSNSWIRGTITIDPAFTATTTGNTAFVVAPGGTFQESFGAAAIASVAFEAVDVPVAAGVVAVPALIPNAQDYILGVKFLEA